MSADTDEKEGGGTGDSADEAPKLPRRRDILRVGLVGAAVGIAAAGTPLLLSRNAAAATFSEDLLPGADNQYSLGSTTSRWRDAHLAGSALLGTQLSLKENPVGQLEVGDTLKGDKAPLHAWSLYARQAFAALRVENSDGFREMHLRDGNSSFNGGYGRFAWILADRLEPQQYSWYEHFTAGQLPTGWTEQGSGTSAGVDGPGGIRRLTASISSKTVKNRRLFSGSGSTMIRSVRPNAEMHTQLGHKVGSRAGVVYCLGVVNTDVADLTASTSNDGITAITEGVYLWYDSSLHADGRWRAVMRSSGVTRNMVPLNGTGSAIDVPVDTAAGHFWRFEYWPAGEGGFLSDTIKVYYDGTWIGIPFDTVPPGGQNLAPLFAVQSRTSAAKTLDVQYYWLWQSEVYNW